MDFELRRAREKLEKEQRERKEKARLKLESEKKAKAEAKKQREAIEAAQRSRRLDAIEAQLKVIFSFFFLSFFSMLKHAHAHSLFFGLMNRYIFLHFNLIVSFSLLITMHYLFLFLFGL